MGRRSMRWVTFLCAGAISAGVATAQAQDKELTKVTFAVTTTNISVGHAAHSSIPRTAGFWEEAGLDVEVIGLKGATEGVQQVASGQVQFATVGPEALMMARAKGLPVKAVYTYARKPIYRIVSLEDSGLTKPEDLKGKIVGVPNMATGSVPFTRAVLKTANIDPEGEVEWLAIGLGATAANALKQKEADVWGSWDTAVAALENGGFKFNYIVPPWMDETLGNVMIASEETIANHPDWAAKVAQGIAKGTIFGLTNPEATIRNHWKVYPQTKPQGGETEEALAKAKHIFNSRFDGLKLPEGLKWGEHIDAQWERMGAMAIDEGLVPADFDIKSSYTSELLDEINDFDESKVVEAAKNSDW